MSAVLKPWPQSPPALEEPSLASVLEEVAETASETLELQEVFERVATAVRSLIAFDSMGVVRILDGALGGAPRGDRAVRRARGRVPEDLAGA